MLKKIIISFCLLLCIVSIDNVYALEQGKIFKANVSGHYYHPVTGEVLDNATPENYSIGESMVKNIVQSVGQFEVTDSGSTYFSFRLGMMNFSNSQIFHIQNYGASGWTTVSATVTNSGSIASGTTKDFVVPASSTSCIVKVSMYVEPMGRDVVFFVVPSGVVESDNTGMVASKVTTVVEVPPTETPQVDTNQQTEQPVVQNEDVEPEIPEEQDEVNEEPKIEEDEVEEKEEEIVLQDEEDNQIGVYIVGLSILVGIGIGVGVYVYRRKGNENEETN